MTTPRYEVPCHVCGHLVPVWRPKPVVKVCDVCLEEENR